MTYDLHKSSAQKASLAYMQQHKTLHDKIERLLGQPQTSDRDRDILDLTRELRELSAEIRERSRRARQIAQLRSGMNSLVHTTLENEKRIASGTLKQFFEASDHDEPNMPQDPSNDLGAVFDERIKRTG